MSSRWRRSTFPGPWGHWSGLLPLLLLGTTALGAGGGQTGPSFLSLRRACGGHQGTQAAALGQGLAEGAPGVEAAGEGVLLVALAHQAQAAGTLVLLGAHVLDVHLVGGTGECAPAASAPPPPRPSLGPLPRSPGRPSDSA